MPYTAGEVRALLAGVLGIDLDDLHGIMLCATFRDPQGGADKFLFWDAAAVPGDGTGVQDNQAILCDLLAYARHLAKDIHGCSDG